MSEYGVFSGPYFPVFVLNTEIYGVNLRIHSKYGKIRTRKHSTLRPFLCSACKLYNNKYMIVSKQIANTLMFEFIAVVVFNLLSRKVLFRNRQNDRNCEKVGYFFKKIPNFTVNYCKIINSWDGKFSGYI